MLETKHKLNNKGKKETFHRCSKKHGIQSDCEKYPSFSCVEDQFFSVQREKKR